MPLTSRLYPDDNPDIALDEPEFMTLHPGEVLSTGTPPGVGMGQKPPRSLRPGDVMTLGIAGPGQQRQQVVEDI